MENKKKLIIPALVIATALGIGAYSISGVEANGGNGYGSLAEKISQRFNLNRDDVQKVFDGNRAEMQQNRASNYEARLTQAVTDGKITEAQKKLIMDKRAEREKEREQNRADHQNLSADQRKIEMEKRKTEIETWAKDNGVDVSYLFGFGRGNHDGMGFGRNANK